MSELDDAIARLEEAVARLEAASDAAKRGAESGRLEDDRVRAVATAIAGRLDAALAKLGRLIEREG
jgi:hypothetical protein